LWPNTNTNICYKNNIRTLFEYYSNTELFAHLCIDDDQKCGWNVKVLISIVLISKLHCCSVQWGLSSITIWHILEQACFCLVITPIRLNVWSRYQVVIVVDLLNMKDFDTYEAGAVYNSPGRFYSLGYLPLNLLSKEAKSKFSFYHLWSFITQSSVSLLYLFCSVLNLLSLKSQETLFDSIWCCCFISRGEHKYDESGSGFLGNSPGERHFKLLWQNYHVHPQPNYRYMEVFMKHNNSQ